MIKFDEHYNSFSKMVIPEYASENQRRGMEMSFYSSAASILSCLHTLNADDIEIFEVELNNLINEIFDKMEEFTIK